jgi:glycosyltransferase involved in cell wall biosynthesis
MRILHLDTGKQMRGGQWQALRLIEGLRARGVECVLLARAGSPLGEAARQIGCQVAPAGFARTALLARRCDLIHAHDARAHTLAALAGGAPLVVSRRVAFGRAGGVLSRWKYGRAARFIAVSDFVKATLMARGVPAEKIAVVYDGVPLLEPIEPPAGRARVLAPDTRDDPEKGLALARHAAQLAGVELQVSASPQRDLPGAAVFVYITYSEGLGSGALLAMSAGVPMVASHIGGLPEIIRHRHNGLLVENRAPAIAAAIRELLDDPPFARRLALAGRHTVEERFTLEHMVSGVLEVYRRVLS